MVYTSTNERIRGIKMLTKEWCINRIDELLQEKHMNYNQLIDNADISSTIYQWKSSRSRDATRCPSLRSINKICDFFGITLSYFFADTPEERTNVKQLEVMKLVDKMTEEQLDAMTTVAKAILNEY